MQQRIENFMIVVTDCKENPVELYEIKKDYNEFQCYLNIPLNDDYYLSLCDTSLKSLSYSFDFFEYDIVGLIEDCF